MCSTVQSKTKNQMVKCSSIRNAEKLHLKYGKQTWDKCFPKGLRLSCKKYFQLLIMFWPPLCDHRGPQQGELHAIEIVFWAVWHLEYFLCRRFPTLVALSSFSRLLSTRFAGFSCFHVSCIPNRCSTWTILSMFWTRWRAFLPVMILSRDGGSRGLDVMEEK